MADSIPDQLQLAWSLCSAGLRDRNPSYVVFEKENGGFWHASVNQPHNQHTRYIPLTGTEPLILLSEPDPLATELNHKPARAKCVPFKSFCCCCSKIIIATTDRLFLLYYRLFRCTLTSIPQTQALLNKAKLPLGLLLHPFKDLMVSYKLFTY